MILKIAYPVIFMLDLFSVLLKDPLPPEYIN